MMITMVKIIINSNKNNIMNRNKLNEGLRKNKKWDYN